MTAEGASSQGGHWAARSWRSRTPLVGPDIPADQAGHGAPRSGRHSPGGHEFRRHRGVRRLPAEPGRCSAARPGRSGAERPPRLPRGRSSHGVPPESTVSWRCSPPTGSRWPGSATGRISAASPDPSYRPASLGQAELRSAGYGSGTVGQLQLAGHHPAGAVQHGRRRTAQSGTAGRRRESGQPRPDHGVPDQARRDRERRDPARADDRRVRGGAGEPAAAGRNRGDRGRDRGRAPEPARARA